MNKYVCTICGYIYDEAAGIPGAGIAPGTKWEALPEAWVCPLCGAGKDQFKLEQPADAAAQQPAVLPEEDLRELSAAELSAVCSNLARGCEKQYLAEEQELFGQLAERYAQEMPAASGTDLDQLLQKINQDLENYPQAHELAAADADRGALRALVWSEKVTRILASLLARCQKEGTDFIRSTHVYVCDICGFIYVGDQPPEICPVCKVPSLKILEVERG